MLRQKLELSEKVILQVSEDKRDGFEMKSLKFMWDISDLDLDSELSSDGLTAEIEFTQHYFATPEITASITLKDRTSKKMGAFYTVLPRHRAEGIIKLIGNKEMSDSLHAILNEMPRPLSKTLHEIFVKRAIKDISVLGDLIYVNAVVHELLEKFDEDPNITGIRRDSS